MPPDAVNRLLAGIELVTPVGGRLRGLDEVHEILDLVRANGYAENVDETALGLRCLAVPVTGPCAETVAAMTLCVPAGRIDRRRRRQMLADLRAAGLRASASLRALNQPPGSA
jgi:DNA-binding IclR family transcriptional regulator